MSLQNLLQTSKYLLIDSINGQTSDSSNKVSFNKLLIVLCNDLFGEHRLVGKTSETTNHEVYFKEIITKATLLIFNIMKFFSDI